MGNRSGGNTPDAYWSILSGKTGTPENRVIAQIGQDARNIQTAAPLGGAVLSSTTDVATVAASLHFNRLPYFDAGQRRPAVQPRAARLPCRRTA